MNNVAKSLQPRNWRSKKIHEAYKKYHDELLETDQCPLCGAITLQEFKHWKIVPNKFPYDGVAEVHDMVVSKRHVSWGELTDEEREELIELKKTVLCEKYDMLFEAFPKNRSVPGHFHQHLIIPKIID